MPDSILPTAPALVTVSRPIAGKVVCSAPLAPRTWFRVGGPAEFLHEPDDVQELAAFLQSCPSTIPVSVIGAASNCIVRDGGVPGCVIRLPESFADVRVEGGTIVAGGAALGPKLAKKALAYGVSGLEFMTGIPGTVGGMVAMNAGAYGRDVSDVLERVVVVDRSGSIRTLSASDLSMGYRTASLPADAVVVEAAFRVAPGDRDRISGEMSRIRTERARTQPVSSRTGGSTFANPPGAKAWELIDRAGCRGLSIGGATVSSLHCNFIVNAGGASASDIEDLGEEIRRRVRDCSGVSLRWEIRRIGTRGAEERRP